MKLWNVPLAAFAAMTVLANDVTVEWTSGETASSLSNGVVALTSDAGGLVTNLTATVAQGDTVTIAGDTLVMGAGATVMVEGLGTLAFTNVIDAQDGTLRLDSPLAAQIDYCREAIGSTNSFTLMFPGYNLDEYEPVMSDCGSSGAEGMYNPNKMYPYHMVRGKEGAASTLDLQMQCFVGGITKCVSIRLKQTADGIAGGVYDALYVNGDVLGEDFRALARHSTTYEIVVQKLKTDGQSKGYGIDQLTMRRVVRPTVRFYAVLTNTVADAYASLQVGASVSAESTGKAGLSASPIAVDEQVDGELVFRNRTLTYKTAAMTGGGSLRAIGDAPVDSPCEALVTNVFTKSFRKISNYRYLTELTNAVARFCGGSVGERTGNNNYGNMYHYTIADSGLVATGQFQRVQGKTIRCVYMEFQQANFQCNARVYAAGYVTFNTSALAQANLGCDMPNLTAEFLAANASGYKLTTQGVATTFDASGCYGLYEATFAFKTPDRMVVALDAPCQLTNSAFSVVGVPGTLVQLRVGNRGALPTNGVVNVYSNAELSLNSACDYNGPYYSDQSCLMRIHAGGRLVQYKSKAYPFGTSQKIELLGGELQLGVKYSGSNESNADSNTYVPFLTLADGARVFGEPFRTGNVTKHCEWKVRGSSPSRCDATIRLTSANATYDVWFDVYDVTGTDEADFVVNGDVVTYDTDATHAYLNVKKVGDGTIRINGAYSNRVAAASIGGGTWLFGASGSAIGEPPFILDGGTLATAAATTNALGALTVLSSGTLKVEPDGLLTFSSFAFGDDVARRAVRIDADVGADAIRCTTALVASQLARFFWMVDGEAVGVKQDANGFLRPYRPGTVLIMR